MEFFNWVVPRNEGLLDRVIRVCVGIAVFAGGVFLVSPPNMANIWPEANEVATVAAQGPNPLFAGIALLLGVIGLILVVSGLIGYCPFYNIIGAWFDSEITTCPRPLSRVEQLERTTYHVGRYRNTQKDYYSVMRQSRYERRRDSYAVNPYERTASEETASEG
jgi:hypothetical protein